jgi:hypothetical protein
MRGLGNVKTVKYKSDLPPLPPDVPPELERPDDLDAKLTADMDEEEKAAWAEWKKTFADPYIEQYTAALGKFLESKGYTRRTAAKPRRPRK